jgi:hypothetical protein
MTLTQNPPSLINEERIDALYAELRPIFDDNALDQATFNKYADAILEAANGDGDELEPLLVYADWDWKMAWLNRPRI